MRAITLITQVLAAGLAFASSADARELRYWGKQDAIATTGVIELGVGEYYEVGVGTEIPKWGRVTDLDGDHLVVVQVRTEAERRELRERGVLVYDVLEIHIPRQDLHHLHQPTRRVDGTGRF